MIADPQNPVPPAPAVAASDEAPDAVAHGPSAMLLDVLPDAALLTDEAGSIVEANALAVRLLGPVRQRKVGSVLPDLLPLPDAEPVTLTLPATADGREGGRRGEQRVEVRCRAVPAPERGEGRDAGRGGRLYLLRAFAALPRAPAFLPAATSAPPPPPLPAGNSILRSFYESAPLAMGVIELQDGEAPDLRILSGNQAAATLFGRTAEDLVEWQVGALGVPDAVRRLWVERFREAERNRRPVRFEYVRHGRDGGGVAYYAFHVSFIALSPALKPRFSFVAENVTERRAAEERLRRSEAAYRAAREGSLDAFYLLDCVYGGGGQITDFRVVDVNRRAEQMCGLPRAALVGQLLGEILPLSRAGGFFDKYRRVFETGETLEEEACLTPGVPDERWVHHQVVPLPHGVAVTSRDVTEARRFRAQMVQQEKLAAMGRLIAGVAHEINNPLAAISGIAQLLALSGDEAVRADAAAIRRMTERATTVVRSLLTFARGGEADPERRAPCLLSDLIAEASALCDYLLRRSDIQMYVLDAPAVHVTINAHQIEQVLVNLLQNAEHALRDMPRERRRVVVSCGAAGGEAFLRVADTGAGIPPEVLGRLFEPFFTTKEPGEGTGLGLSLCHGIARAHGGRITADNAPEGGAVFTLFLPLASEKENVPRQEEQSVEGDEGES